MRLGRIGQVLLFLNVLLLLYYGYQRFFADPEGKISLEEFQHSLELDNAKDTVLLSYILKEYDATDRKLKKKIAADYQRYRAIIPPNKDRITAKQIDYAKAIATYHSRDMTKTLFLLENIFKKDLGMSDLEGYIVACYYGLGLFREAAEIKAKYRGLSKKSLHDYAKCIRNFGLVNSYEEAKSFNQMSQDATGIYDIWIYIPIEVSSYLFQNIHSQSILKSALTDRDKVKIYEYLSTHPNGKFTSLAHYLVGNYDKALEGEDKDYFHDVYLYAKGYSIVQKYAANYVRFKKGQQIKRYEEKEIEIALACFRNYTKSHPKAVHADDAAYWVAFCHALLKNHAEIFPWLNRVDSLGNQDRDYQRIKKRFKAYILDQVPLNISLENIDFNAETPFLNRLVVRLSDKGSSDEIAYIINKFELNSKAAKASFQDLIYNMLVLLPDQVIQQVISKIRDADKREWIGRLRLHRQFIRGDIEVLSDRDAEDLSRPFDLEWTSCRSELKDINHCDSLIKDLIVILKHRGDHVCNKYDCADLILGAIDRMKKKLGGRCQKIDHLDFLKIQLLYDYDVGFQYYYYKHLTPEYILLEKNIVQFLANYPNSEYRDDVLYLSARFELIIFERYKNGEQVVQKMIEDYPRSEWTERALELLANCSIYYYAKYQKYNKLILSMYPESRYAVKAKVRLDEMEKVFQTSQTIFYEQKPYLRYHLIVGSLKTKEEAMGLAEQLIEMGYSDTKIIDREEQRYLVSLLNYPTRSQASSNISSIDEFDGVWILPH
ncbi:MAG: SPOR domain-containing protein [Bacteroidota bacterium]